MTERSLEALQVGDRVSIRCLGRRSEKGAVKIAYVTKTTPAAVYADEKRFSRTSQRGIGFSNGYALLGPSTPEEIAAWEEKRAKQRDLQELVPVGHVRPAEFGEGWLIDGLSEEAIKRIGKALKRT